MPNFGPIIKSLKYAVEKKDYLQMYQRTMSNSVLDEVSIYVAYRQNTKRLNYTIEDLDKYTPEWIKAKYKLLGDVDE